MSSSSEDRKMIEIVRGLIQRTEKREVNWRERPGREYCYEADLASANVEIGTVDDDGTAPYDFRIYNRDTTTRLATLSGRDADEAHEPMQTLHALVDRQVRGVDDVFDALLEELSGE